jgi:uncharacterized protein (TIGR02246 family)
MPGTEEVEALHRALLQCWNERDADGYGALFTADGSMVGFDGSTVEGSVAVTEHLAGIFGDHEPARYVAKVREVRFLADDVAVVRAVAGMIPPGGDDIKPEVNAIQVLVAVRSERWRVAHFQNTPASFDGRPDERDALTNELRALLPADA